MMLKNSSAGFGMRVYRDERMSGEEISGRVGVFA
jgi:hypothetical protein